jgi:hypothetical protein
VTLLEMMAQAAAGEDEDAWHRASDQWRQQRIEDMRRALGVLAEPPKAAVWPVAYAAMAVAESLNTHEAQRVARAALAALADLR